MIMQNRDLAQTFLNSFRDIALIDSLSEIKIAEFDEVAISVMSMHFPGAILAYPIKNGAVIYYAIAESAAEWRRLRPLLMAYAGPTLTSFNGWPVPLDSNVPVEAFLLSGGWHVVAKLVPAKDSRISEMVRRSFLRMLDTISKAPTTTHVAPQSTSSLIANFVDALNGNNRLEAERILEICISELRVDALNLSFLRIQLFSHFDDWASVREMPEFQSLCYTRKPPVVTGALLEALYQTSMAHFEGEDWIEHQRKCWHEEIRQFAKPLIHLPIPNAIRYGGLKLYAWYALETEPRVPDLEDAILKYRDSIGELANALDRVGRDGSVTSSSGSILEPPTINTPIALAQGALANANNEDTLASIRNALAQFDLLDEMVQKQLISSEPFRSFWQTIQVEAGGEVPPSGWIDWLGRLSAPEFTNSFALLKHAVAEWPASELVDFVGISEYANALTDVEDTPPASERIADAIPLLTAWVVDDPRFPRPAMAPIYEALMYHLVVGARRGSEIYDSSSVLIRALLAIGLPASQYRALLDDCLELIAGGVGTRNVYWILDVLEETIFNSSPSVERRQDFWYAVYAKISPLRKHLSPGQSLVLNRISNSLGWDSSSEIEVFTVPESGVNVDKLRSGLTGLSIAIYSLTESAARQAEVAINSLAPNVKISISCDTGGTPSLKSMAQNADIFVIATSSAKHAATGFIQQMRPRTKPTLFASGRGFSSIVRAIENFILDSDTK